MTENLTRGVIDQIHQGKCPKLMIVKVQAIKALGEPNKYRLKITDGQSAFVHCVFDLSHLLTKLSVPKADTVIKISALDTPPGVPPHVVKPLKDDKYALIVTHFTELTSNIGAASSSSSSSSSSASPSSSGGRTNGTWVSPTMSTPPSTAPQSQMMPPPSKNGSGSSHHNSHGVKRNLESDFGGSPAKRPAAGGREATHTVDRLSNMMNKFSVKVVVESKGTVREVNNSRWGGLVQDCILSDNTGSIQLTAFKHDTALLDQLIQGKTYIMEGMSVKPANPNFNPTKHQFSLTWSHNTKVTGPILTNPVRINYNFTKIKDIPSLPSDSVIDVLAWVRQTHDLVQFTSRAGQDYKKRELLLADNSNTGASVSMVLWNKEAEEWDSHDKILAFRNVVVKEFNGVKNLSLGKGKYEESPDCDEMEALEYWVSGMREAIEIVSPSQPPGAPSSQTLAELDRGPITCIQEIKEAMAENRDEKRFVIAGHLVRINTDTMWYRGHHPTDGKICRKKVVEDGGNPGLYNCKCGDKKLPVAETELRYMVNMNLMDATSNIWAVMFDARVLFGDKTAQELSDLKDKHQDKFLELIKTVQFSQVLASVSAKIETFNGAPKLKLTVHSAKKIWTVEKFQRSYMRRRWEEIVALEKELDLAHEELGVAINGEAAYSENQ